MSFPIGYVDGYKFDHRRQYPKGTTRVYSNFTARGTRVPGQKHTFFFGLQYFLHKYLIEEFGRDFFDKDVDDVCDRYQRRLNGYLGPNQIGTEHIRALHDLGYLPLEFRALPEGTRVPLRVPYLTVENTHDDFGWLTNYVETLMSNVLWMPTTSATTASRMRSQMTRAAARTGSSPEFVDWQGHDFSFRGMAGVEAAALSGAGHLIFFRGTDTVPAIELVQDYYGVGAFGERLPADYLIGGSVAATEHSVMCADGQTGERGTFERLLDLYPSGIVSAVSDTWDLWRVLTEILPSLKDRIADRDGKLVIRPDSGDPVKILCGDDEKVGPARKGVVELLWDTFGGTLTSTGHRLLDSHVGSIYGDAINYDRAGDIFGQLYRKGFASANVVLGVGSYSYQYVTRDTYGMAMKATLVKVDGKWRELFKDPVTDDGLKKSARGRLVVYPDEDGELVVRDRVDPGTDLHSLLQPVWRDGQFLRRDNFEAIRRRARRDLAACPSIDAANDNGVQANS